MKKLANILAFFESVDAWVVKHPREACALGCIIGLGMGAVL